MQYLHKWFFQQSSKWMRLFAFFLLFALVSGIGVFDIRNIYQISMSWERVRVNNLAKNLDVQLASRLMATEILAVNVDGEMLEPKDLQNLMKRSLPLLNLYNVKTYDRKGILLAQVKNIPCSVLPKSPEFESALQGKRLISDKYACSAGGHKLIQMLVPIYDENHRIRGVLVAEILATEVGNMLNGVGISQGKSSVFIVDGHNHVICPVALPAGNVSGTDGKEIDLRYMENSDNLYISAPLESAKWKIVLVVPRQEVYFWVFRKVLPHVLLLAAIVLCAALLYIKLRQEKVYQENVKRLRIERLLSVNQLAAGLAHEVRNPLTSIKGFIQLMAIKGDKPPIKSHMDIILTEIERINKLIGEFQHLTRPLGNPAYNVIDMENVVFDVVTLMRGQCVHKNVSLLFLPGVGTRKKEVIGDESQLKQVLINLIKNAIDAVNKNGEIDVSMETEENKLVVRVKDNGTGMPAKIVKKIGTPFFTTKETGNGLGLSVCYNIIRNHGGEILVESKEGKGTVFSIQLPYVK
jgi:signal transduction histidine kinase